MDITPGQVYHNTRAHFDVRVIPNPDYRYPPTHGHPRQYPFHVQISPAGLGRWHVVGRTSDLEGAAKQAGQYLG